MERRPSAWMTELVDAVAGCMEAHSPMGALGWRYHEEDELTELIVSPTPVELVGGEHDGAIVMAGFSLDVQALQAVFEHVTALQWHAQGFSPDDEDGPSLSLEGTYQGHLVWLRVLAEAPEDEVPGLQLDTSASPCGRALQGMLAGHRCLATCCRDTMCLWGFRKKHSRECTTDTKGSSASACVC